MIESDIILTPSTDDGPNKTYADTAAYLGITQQALRRMVQYRMIPHYRFGPQTVRFDITEIKAWVEERHFKPRAKRKP